uniref:B-cell receptor CD22 first Ig-like domain-containing protein n=1 Tax=Salmo trutta TaxID=8032 RepID=A0A674A664_SALTR
MFLRLQGGRCNNGLENSRKCVGGLSLVCGRYGPITVFQFTNMSKWLRVIMLFCCSVWCIYITLYSCFSLLIEPCLSCLFSIHTQLSNYGNKMWTNITVITSTFWFTKMETEDIGLDPEYAGHVEYRGDKKKDCTLRITDLRESDSATYRFRLLTDQEGGTYTGKLGVTLCVTGKVKKCYYVHFQLVLKNCLGLTLHPENLRSGRGGLS